jgi:glycosyltransferase involved in cell wall biosynthesis
MIDIAPAAGDYHHTTNGFPEAPARFGASPTRNTIVHVAEFGAPYASNFISSLQALGRSLKDAGLRQVLILPARAKRRNWVADWQAKKETPLYFLSEGSLWQRAGEVAAIVQEEGGALIHSHFCPADWITWLARIRLAFRAGDQLPPLIWHYQSPPVSAGLTRCFLGPLKYRLLSRSIDHVAVSEGTLEMMLAKGIPRHLCHHLPNSINFERSTCPVIPRAQMRADLGIAPNQKCFLQFGHDPERKGVDSGLKAFGKIFPKHPDAVLVIVGEDKLRAYVRALLGDSKPAWLRLAAPRETAADFYSAADFFLSPSRSEGLPYAVLEALANRLPVVATDIPGLEWARGLNAVRMCSVRNVGSLADRVNELLFEEVEAREEATARACDYVRAHHSSIGWARRMLGIYSPLIGLTRDIASAPMTASTAAAFALETPITITATQRNA